MNDQRINFIIANINILGGVERVTKILSQEFAKQNARVTIHSIYSTHCETPFNSAVNLIHYGITPPDAEKNFFSKIKRLISNGLTLRSSLNLDSGFVIFQGFYLAAYLPFLQINSPNRIVCEHNAYDAPGKASRMARFFIYKIFSPLIIVLTEPDKKYFQSLGFKRVAKIYNPTPYPELNNLPRNSKKTLIALGRFTSQKRFDLMIELCYPLLQTRPDWTLKLQGSGEDLEKMKSIIAKYSLKDRVIILPQGDVTQLYSEGCIFLMTSAFEGLPMTLIESMSFGIPAVVMNCSSGLSEIVKDGKTGFLTPMNDRESFIEKVQALMDNRFLREEMGQNALESANNFSLPTILAEWEKLLQ